MSASLFFICAATAFGDAEIIKGQVLVQFRPFCRDRIALDPQGLDPARTGLDPVDDLGRRFGVSRVEKVITDPRLGQEEDFGLDRLYLVHFPETIVSGQVVDAYKNLAEVEDALPNWAVPVLDKPNDPRFGWHMDKCKVPEAFTISRGDPSVIICCIDNGVDWVHEDIKPNLWINTKEDINHNGRFDTTSAASGGDLNGVDDDGNGKIDDVIGWNFKTNKPNPTPDIIDPWFCSHGTSTTGVAAAATNNGIGVAGTGWRCRAMAINCDLDNAHINATLAIQGVQYAASNGAKVINMSFGGGPDMYGSVLRYATKTKGCIVFGAAGNDNISTIQFPAGDTNVLAVAATSPNDRKSSYSNYGAWVDLAAPGDQIPSPEIDNWYSNVDGTSIASPVAAGIAALVWAKHPTWTATQVAQAILTTCDSMPDPFFYQNKMGKGRINAYRAITSKIGVDEPPASAPHRSALFSAPSPFPGSTVIGYQVGAPGRVTLAVYDRTGATVRTLVDGLMPAGRHFVAWNGRDAAARPVPAGVYFYRLESGGTDSFTKAVLVR